MGESELFKPNPNFSTSGMEKYTLKVSSMLLSDVFQFIILGKYYIQKNYPFVTPSASRTNTLCNDVGKLGLKCMRENGSFLAHLGVPKTSQL